MAICYRFNSERPCYEKRLECNEPYLICSEVKRQITTYTRAGEWRDFELVLCNAQDQKQVYRDTEPIAVGIHLIAKRLPRQLASTPALNAKTTNVVRRDDFFGTGTTSAVKKTPAPPKSSEFNKITVSTTTSTSESSNALKRKPSDELKNDFVVLKRIKQGC